VVRLQIELRVLTKRGLDAHAASLDLPSRLIARSSGRSQQGLVAGPIDVLGLNHLRAERRRQGGASILEGPDLIIASFTGFGLNETQS
jgi:hypothetical protein